MNIEIIGFLYGGQPNPAEIVALNIETALGLTEEGQHYFECVGHEDKIADWVNRANYHLETLRTMIKGLASDVDDDLFAEMLDTYTALKITAVGHESD